MYRFHTITKGVAYFPGYGSIEFVQFPHHIKIIPYWDHPGFYKMYLYQYGDPRNSYLNCGKCDVLFSFNNDLDKSIQMDRILYELSLDDLIGKCLRIHDQYTIITHCKN